MSRSPRRNLRMAQDALGELFSVCERHPEARAELVAAIGEDGLREIQAAHAAIERATARLDAPSTEGRPKAALRDAEEATGH